MHLHSTAMATSDICEYFTIGGQVKIVTLNYKEYKGEVVAFDHKTKTLIIKSLSPGQHNKFDLQVFNLEFVRQLESSEEPGPHCIPDPLPPVPLAKVRSRIIHNMDEKRRQLELVGVDVPQEGQLLMNSIARTISDVRWEKDKIVVMESVIIMPPYTVDHCQIIGKVTQQTQSTLSHLRKVVNKHYQDLKQPQPAAQNDTRTSMSPSPAPSSSSTSSAS